ncbi:MAG: ATP-binding protein [Planctomycetota bacterium]|nr:ATP-binding protein [Planctomycetota bacterium]
MEARGDEDAGAETSGGEVRAAEPLGDGRSLEQILSSQRLENLGRLATGIAHDFNNVLGVILGYVELAKMASPDSKSANHLDKALGTIGRARTLADRLMGFARGAAREDSSGDLNAVVEEVRELLSETADRRVAVSLHLANDTPWVPVFPDHLAQVVMNLCVNALDAMGDEQGRLTIETGRTEIPAGHPSGLPEGTCARLRVTDTGPGVPREARRFIFEPYYSTRDDGTGLGLWAVRQIVERAGGTLEVENMEPGARFTVHFPTSPKAAAAAAAKASSAASAEATTPRGERILIVDDEAGVRFVTRSYLEAAGYDVLEAETGEDGLAVLEDGRGPIDLVLLDLHLADISGQEMARRIGLKDGAPSIVVMTGDPRPDQVGPLPHVGKPFLRQELLDAVQSALEPPPTA